ncbi:MAG TPA: signal recognition particle-docking protein FtsY, partial [Chlamydiales bacterium]|nr:signal recognition particle-docking protein FtsY [Chlamydiales bacterium]
AKVRRICKEKVPQAPHETLLVLDATIGQNALDQAKTFHQFTPISGIILTKLDGSAKGGIAALIQKELNIPILWVGMGEKEEDLIPFDPAAYLDALLS